MTTWRNSFGTSRLAAALAVALALLAACGGGSQSSTAVSAGAPQSGLPANPLTLPGQPVPDALVVKAQADVPQPVAAFSLSAADEKSMAEDKNQRLRDVSKLQVKASSWALTAVPVAELNAAIAAMNTTALGVPRQIALGRAVAPAQSGAALFESLMWQPGVNGTLVATSRFASAGASGLRLGVQIEQLPETATVVFYTPGARYEQVFSGAQINALLAQNKAAGDTRPAARVFWSPYLAGDQAIMEVTLAAGIDTSAVRLGVGQLSHFLQSPLAETADLMPRLGESASCNLDVSCYLPANPQANAVARMVFTGETGGTFLCSGTLLADRASSGTPYVLSANHCISKQTVASTLQTFWFYRSAACNSGALSSATVTRSGGAVLLYASSTTDTAFLRLLAQPPPGAVFAGWSLAGVAAGQSATGVHHPRGDLQKISFGSPNGYRSCQVTSPTSGSFSCGAAAAASAGFFDVTYTAGTTEGGSSGSGVFVSTASGPTLVGQLYGGSSSCTNPSGSNIYGRFDTAYYAGLSPWLEGSAAPANFALNITQAGNGAGLVNSSPAGISCGSECATSFPSGTTVTLTATAAAGAAFSGWSGACTGTLPCRLSLTSARAVTANFAGPALSLGAALDNTAQAFTTLGDSPFSAQSRTFHVGGSAAQSGAVADNQSAVLQTALNGPGVLSFDWKVSSEANHDFLEMSVDGVVQNRLSGESAWISTLLKVPAGAHTVAWRYTKDFSATSGQDAGWVDNVRFTANVNAVGALQNGDFESGNQNWLASRGELITNRSADAPTFAGAGNRHAALCGYDNCKDVLLQDVALPTDRPSVLMELSYFVSTQKQSLTTAYDAMLVQVVSLTQPALKTTVGFFTNLDAAGTWRKLLVDISQFAGQTVRLIFSAITDSAMFSSFYVDNISITALAGSNTAPTTGWWWNVSEPGRGFAIEQRGNKIFLGGFYYDTGGAAAWSVSTLTQQSDGSYIGVLERYSNGQSLSGAFRLATGVKIADVVLTFTTASVGALQVRSVSGAASTIALQRFPISSPTAFADPSASFENGWWWDAAEPGRGYFLEVQGRQAFVSMFAYEGNGDAVWYVSYATLANGSNMPAPLLQYGNGQTLQGPPLTATQIGAPGTLQFSFSAPGVGTLRLPSGALVNLTRFLF